MVRSRIGFTVIEMVIVMVIIGIMSAYAFPKVSQYEANMNVGAARDRIAEELSLARSSAVQRNRTTAFIVSGNRIWVSAKDSSGAVVTVVPPVQLDSLFGVSLAVTDTMIYYSTRGLAIGLIANQIFRVVGSTRDSVCISPLGADLGRACAL